MRRGAWVGKSMSRRKPRTTGAEPSPPSAESTPRATAARALVRPRPLSVLVVCDEPDALASVGAAVRGLGGVVCEVQTPACAMPLLASRSWDVVVMAPRPADGGDVTRISDAAAAYPGTSFVLLSSSPTVDEAVGALRAGAADVVSPVAADLSQRLAAAGARARRIQVREGRIERLRRACRTLNDARREVTRHVGSLCDDMVSAYQDLTDQLADVRLSAEFSSQIAGELDVETLLRTALEFILTKTGPTNGAIFLPSSSGDFSVGAYVNYSCPRDTVEVLLDNLAGAAAARLEDERRVRTLNGTAELTDYLGPAADWMGDSSAMMLACRDESECLAVVALFRERGNPFPRALIRTLETIGGLFGRQLARVIRVHHRHLPKGQWGALGDGEDEGFGLAA